METAKKHLSTGFNILGTISVKGEDVDRMALARQELRAAYAALEKAQKTAEEEKAEVKKTDG